MSVMMHKGSLPISMLQSHLGLSNDDDDETENYRSDWGDWEGVVDRWGMLN